jgi:hypothetical protein
MRSGAVRPVGRTKERARLASATLTFGVARRAATGGVAAILFESRASGSVQSGYFLPTGQHSQV